MLRGVTGPARVGPAVEVEVLEAAVAERSAEQADLGEDRQLGRSGRQRDGRFTGEGVDERDAVAAWLGRHRYPAGFSSWPPNSLRMAESTLSAKSASPRELNRS